MKRTVLFLAAFALVVAFTSTPTVAQEKPQVAQDTPKEVVPAVTKPSESSPIVERPIFTSGERWVYSENGERVALTFLRKEEDTLVFLLERDGAVPRLRYDTLDHNKIKGVENSETVWEYQPHAGSLNFPLRVGKSWTTAFSYRRAPRLYFTATNSVSVVAYEKVTVPAGTFWAYRLEALVTRAGRNPIHETYWYAPAVQRIIKSESPARKMYLELLAYRRGQERTE